MGGTASKEVVEAVMTAGEVALAFVWDKIKSFFTDMAQKKKVSRRELTMVT